MLTARCDLAHRRGAMHRPPRFFLRRRWHTSTSTLIVDSASATALPHLRFFFFTAAAAATAATAATTATSAATAAPPQ
jgi:hypothetical protein